jgi:hypothetical protein
MRVRGPAHRYPRAGGSDLRVVRRHSHDLFVPFAAVRSLEGERITLDISAEQANQQAWERPDRG